MTSPLKIAMLLSPRREVPVQFALFTLCDFFPDRQDEGTYYRDALSLYAVARARRGPDLSAKEVMPEFRSSTV